MFLFLGFVQGLLLTMAVVYRVIAIRNMRAAERRQRQQEAEDEERLMAEIEQIILQQREEERQRNERQMELARQREQRRREEAQRQEAEEEARAMEEWRERQRLQNPFLNELNESRQLMFRRMHLAPAFGLRRRPGRANQGSYRHVSAQTTQERQFQL